MATSKPKEKTKRPANKPWYHTPLGKIGLAFIIFMVEQFTTSNILFRENYITLAISLIANGLLIGGLIYFIIWHNRKYHDQTPMRIKDISIKSVVYVLKILVITIIVNGLSVIIMNHLQVVNKISSNQNNIDQLSNFNLASYIFVLALACIIAPVCEEFIFRYLPALGTTNRKPWLTSFAILFVFCHLISDLITLPLSNLNTYILIAIHAGQYAVTAFFLTRAYYKNGNMAVNMSTHALWNFSAAMLSR